MDVCGCLVACHSLRLSTPNAFFVHEVRDHSACETRTLSKSSNEKSKLKPSFKSMISPSPPSPTTDVPKTTCRVDSQPLTHLPAARGFPVYCMGSCHSPRCLVWLQRHCRPSSFGGHQPTNAAWHVGERCKASIPPQCPSLKDQVFSGPRSPIQVLYAPSTTAPLPKASETMQKDQTQRIFLV